APESAGDSGRYSAFDNRDFVSVNLLGGEQRPVVRADCVAKFAVRGFKPLQYFGFIGRNVDAGNSLREKVATNFNRAKRRELFEGKLRHFSFQFEARTSREFQSPKLRGHLHDVMLSGAKHL